MGSTAVPLTILLFGLCDMTSQDTIANNSSTTTSRQALTTSTLSYSYIVSNITAPPEIKISPCAAPVDFSKMPEPTPEWFIQFYRNFEEIRCRNLHFEWTHNFTQATCYDRHTRRLMPWQAQCDIAYDWAFTNIIKDYYRAFYKLGPDANSRLGDPIKMTHIICFLLTPVALCTFMFGMYVIRKILLNDDSHLFIYHSVLIFSDMCCYVLNTTHVTDTAQMAQVWICYTSFYFAAYSFQNFAGKSWQPHETASFGLSNMIQALLAADRAVSLAFPMFYRIHANRRSSLILVGIMIVINTIVWLGQLLLTEPWRMVILGAFTSTPQFKALDGLTAAFGILRTILFVASWSVQAVGCLVVCALIFKAKRDQANAKKGKGKKREISMVPCYLLIGTCFMNLAGCTSQSIYLVAYYFVNTKESQQWAGSINNAQLMFIPILNNLGFYIHCIVCKQYRDVVKKVARTIYRKAKAMITCTEYVPYDESESSVSSGVSNTSVLSRKSRQISVSPLNEKCVDA